MKSEHKFFISNLIKNEDGVFNPVLNHLCNKSKIFHRLKDDFKCEVCGLNLEKQQNNMMRYINKNMDKIIQEFVKYYPKNEVKEKVKIKQKKKNKLLYKLCNLHKHKFVFIESETTIDEKIGIFYVWKYKCKKCGLIKTKTFDDGPEILSELKRYNKQFKKEEKKRIKNCIKELNK